MSGWLILGVALIYIVIAIQLYLENKPGLALAFAGYAVSNVGLFLAAL